MKQLSLIFFFLICIVSVYAADSFKKSKKDTTINTFNKDFVYHVKKAKSIIKIDGIIDETDWDAAGDLDASLRKKGTTIPPMDVIIAQVCLHHKVFLFTLDEHFSSVSGLKLFEP